MIDPVVSPTPDSRNKHRRSFLRFELRTLLMLVLAVSVLAAIGTRLHGRLRQRTAAAVVQSFGALTRYEFDGAINYGLPYEARWDWIYTYQPVVEVDLCPGWALPPDQASMETSTGDVTDQRVAWLCAFPELRRVNLSHTAVTNRGLQHLSSLSKIRSLNLSATSISNEGLRRVIPSSLRDLNLSGTQIDDEAVGWLNECVRLEELILGETYHFPRHGRSQAVSAAHVTDAGLARLKGESLRVLNLRGTAVTDAGLVYISQFSNLERLNLVNTRITDNGLQHLHTLKQLWELRLAEEISPDDAPDGPVWTECNATPRGVRQLQEALPALQVTYGVNTAVPEVAPPSAN